MESYAAIMPVVWTVSSLARSLKRGQDSACNSLCVGEYLGFPEPKDNPAALAKQGLLLSVALDVPSNLGHPILRVGARLELLPALFPIPTMPEVAVTEDHDAAASENDIRAPGE